MINFVQQWKLLGAVLILLSGCTKENCNPVCVAPPLKEYTREFQEKLAQEIGEAPLDAVFPLVIQDYAMLRHQIRAGCSSKK